VEGTVVELLKNVLHVTSVYCND